MLEADLHCHSHFSNCGLHSFVELLSRARDNGMHALAITDHGPALKGKLTSVFFERLVDPVPAIRPLKGMECNLGEQRGTIDAPAKFVPWCDVILLGIHPNTPEGLGEQTYTDLLIAAMEANPCIDILTHLNSSEYPVDFTRVARAAQSLSVAIELNNSKVALGRIDTAVTMRLLDACVQARCSVAVCSDAHALNEIGDDSAIRPLIARAGIDESLIVNSSAAGAISWLDSRRGRKRGS